MNEVIEKRKHFIVNTAYIAIILGLAYVSFKYLIWVVAPFMIAFLFAVMLQCPLRYLDKKTNKKIHSILSIGLVILCLLIVIVPIIFIIAGIVDTIKEFIAYITLQLNDIEAFLDDIKTWLLNFLGFLPDGIYNSVSTTIVEFFEKLSSSGADKAAADSVAAVAPTSSGLNLDTIKDALKGGLSSVFSIVKNIPSFLISTIIGIIAWIFFTKDYDYIVRFIQHQLPEGKKNLLVEFKQVFNKTIVTMFKAYGIIMCITFIELFLGLFIMNKIGVMDNSYYILIAVATAVFDILPVAGSGGVLIPWAVFSFFTGNNGQAIGLIILYVVISIIRQYIEPRIVGSSLGVHPIVTLIGLYVGLKLFGFMGMFLVPLTIMTLKAFNDTGRISIWKISPSQRN